MTLNEITMQMQAERFAGGTVALFFILLSLVQISPIRINPWDAIFIWLGKKLNIGLEKRLSALEGCLDTLQKHVQDLWIANHRQSILTFARECRTNIAHDPEEWSNILNLCEEYELYAIEHSVRNGVVRENTRYIRELYQQLSRDHRI
jgi:hypothetical protein